MVVNPTGGAQAGTTRGENRLRVAAVQMNSDDNVAGNLERCRTLLERAAAEGARVAVLPENFAYVGGDRVGAARSRSASRAGDQPGAGSTIEETIRGFASELGIAVIAGGFPETSPDPLKPYNTSTLVDASGSVIGSYRKIHLFDVNLPTGMRFSESSSTAPGSSPAVFTVHGRALGVTICYDLRFPELYRALARLGAEVLVVTAAFTLETGRDHWHVLLRARAIESQCWVIGAAQWGRHLLEGKPSERVSYGHSLIIDPWGTVVAEASDGVGVVTADLDFGLLESVRRKMPCLDHRRL